MKYQFFQNNLVFIIIFVILFMIVCYYWMRYILDIEKRNKRMNVQIQLLKAIAEKLEVRDEKIDEILNDLPKGEKAALLADDAAISDAVTAAAINNPV